MRRIWVMMIIIVIASIYVLGVHLPYQLVLVHGYMGNGKVWREKGFINTLSKDFSFENIKTPSLYDEWEKKEGTDWMEDSRATIEKFGELLYDNHIKPANTESIIIAHSMGGLFARYAALKGNKVKGIITMGSPHRGATASEKWRWIGFLATLNALAYGPILMDTYPETQWVRKKAKKFIYYIAAGIILILSLFALGKFLPLDDDFRFAASHFSCSLKFYITDFLNGLVEFAILIGLAALVMCVELPQQAIEAMPGSKVLNKLNSCVLPAKSSDNLKTFYAYICGKNDNVFDMVANHYYPEGTNLMLDTLTASTGIMGLYCWAGVYHLARSIGWFWINPYRFALGCMYITSGVGLSAPGIKGLYILWLFDGKSSDGFIPAWSQKIPGNVIPKGVPFFKVEVNDHHEKETWGNSQSVEKVKTILWNVINIGIVKESRK